jgi:hypothetical protein
MKQQVSVRGSHSQAQPDKWSNAREPGFIGPQPQHVTDADASDLGEIVHWAECKFAGARLLAHTDQLIGNEFASGNAGLRAAIEHFLDGVQRSVIDALTKCDIDRFGG